MGKLKGAKGSIQCGLRPVLVTSNDVGNHYSTIVEVCPISSQVHKAKLPTHVILDTNTGLKQKSYVMFEQKQTIDQSELIELAGEVPYSMTKEIDRAYNASGGVEPNKFDIDEFVTEFESQYKISNKRLLLAMCRKLENYMQKTDIEFKTSEMKYDLHSTIINCQTQIQSQKQSVYA